VPITASSDYGRLYLRAKFLDAFRRWIERMVEITLSSGSQPPIGIKKRLIISTEVVDNFVGKVT
ncbi:MAG: hypothetical protein JAZ05_06745, partial [Candidatus Thiodiazotropha taylori]|nr:hypothetical protein [Candidatus Thiodiazotropha taylori]MCW4291715.1 hypothetical protein [Candidatus Thiodiazotropha taylori]